MKKNTTNIVIICLTLREDNKTYYAKAWIKNDDIWPVDPKDNLYQWIKKLSELLRFLKVVFIIDDIIVNKDVFNRRQSLLELSTSGRHRGQSLLELSTSGRHRGHYLWLLTQSYFSIPKKLSEQAKAIFVWYPKARADLKTIHDGNDVLTDHELVVARNFFKKSKPACLYIQNELPHGFTLLNESK